MIRRRIKVMQLSLFGKNEIPKVDDNEEYSPMKPANLSPPKAIKKLKENYIFQKETDNYIPIYANIPRNPFKYIGNKSTLWEIHKYVPPHDVCIEPFAGGLGFTLYNLKPQKIILNDINTELINLYEGLKNDLTYVLDGFKDFFLDDSSYFYNERQKLKDEQQTEIHKILHKYINNKYSFFGRGKEKNKLQKANYKDIKELFFHLSVMSLILKNKDADFYSMDVFEFCEKIHSNIPKNTFIYADPPYAETYQESYESDKWTFDDLDKLLDRLTQCGLPFAVSEKYNEQTHELAKKYKLNFIKTKRQTMHGHKMTEIFMANYKLK